MDGAASEVAPAQGQGREASMSTRLEKAELAELGITEADIPVIVAKLEAEGIISTPHQDAPAPEPEKRKKTRSDKGKPRLVKAAEPVGGVITKEQAARICDLMHDRDTRREELRTANYNMRAADNELQSYLEFLSH
jgi:hypothetical protein